MGAVAAAEVTSQEIAKHVAPPQENVVMPPLRKDLVITQQVFEERTYYVVKDPVSLQYFRLAAEDFELSTLFDGVRTFGAVRDLWLLRHPHLRLEYTADEINERIVKFANDLAMMQFLAVPGERVKARMDATKKQKGKKGGINELTNKLFFFRKSLYDPDVIFGRMAKPVAWIWTNACFWISWLIIALGAVVFIYSAEGLDQALANLFNWNNLALMWVTTIVLKSIHELGHGLTCKHFGGEVHEVGFMSLVFTPYFFVNVSDSWTMPNRKHRMLVSFAGIYVELVFAALAVFLWAVVQPGWFKDFLFNIIIISSVSTLIFNANPLMRFDGYYILIDWLEVPNLQAKSRALVQGKITSALFGKDSTNTFMARMPLPKKRLWLFYTYAVLSWLYGYYVIYSLIIFMGPHLEPLGLEVLADAFAVLALTGWVAVPLVHFVQKLQLTKEDLKPGGRWRRIAKVFGIPLALFVVFCFVPVQREVKRHGAVELAQPESVRPETYGFIEEIYVKEGDQVQPGQKLAKLGNRDLQLKLVEMEQVVKEYEMRKQKILGIGKTDELQQIETMIASATLRFKRQKEEFEKLELKARTSGTVLSKDLHHRIGEMLKPNDSFCEIASLNPMRIKVPLSEQQVRYVKPGDKVIMKVSAFPRESFEGVVAGKPMELDSTDFPLAFSKERGGDVATFHDQETGREKLLEHTYVVTVEVQNPNNQLRYNMTMRAKIETGRTPFGKIAYRWIADLISLDYLF